jgi:glycosyltransferase involved in cell wall biosynthesis
MMDWSLIVFSYNEGNTLAKVVKDCVVFLKVNGNEGSEIIVVDDGSTDNTVEVCKDLSQRFAEVIIVRHSSNQGIGEALRTGYVRASKSLVCAIPGDGQFDVMELKQIQATQDRLFYSFFRLQKHYNPYRMALNKANEYFNKWFLGVRIKDVNWIKVYSKKQLASISLELRSSLIESEIVAKLTILGFQCQEIQSKYLPRTDGISRGGSFNTLKKVLLDTLKCYLTIKAFREKVRVKETRVKE